ncbi:MAG: DNA-directed RNA polymerase subunit A', partial [Nitrososphaeria archaeon]
GLNEIGVPMKIAENLTVPIYVTKWNIEEAKKYLERESYPTIVNFISKEGVRRRVTATNRAELLESLQPGVILERQLIDHDIVLFNRQPTLHRISIMAHYVKVLPGRTFRIFNCTVKPYNADFDGDEMNIHAPQSLEALAEARYLMDVKDCILSPRDGLPIIHAEEDLITGVYMLTRDGAYFTKDEASRLLASVGIYELPKPSKEGYSGKDIFSLLLPVGINLESKSASKAVIKNSKLVSGYIGGDFVGESGKLILEIFAKYGSA